MSKTVVVTYLGPYDEITVPLPGGGWVTCKRNGTVEVPEEIARGRPADDKTGKPGAGGLLDQVDAWKLAATSPQDQHKPTSDQPERSEEPQ